jgi:hypothetical protein
MSPLFGNKEQPQTDDAAALQPEVDRLHALTLPQLGAEVMTKGFGPTCPTSDGLPSVAMIAEVFVPHARRSTDTNAVGQLNNLVAEGVQVIEHASLVRSAVWGGEGGTFFQLTRLGRAALDQNAVDRILGGGKL